MRICLIGDHRGDLDEGMKNITFYLLKELSKRHEVLSIYQREALSKATLRKVKDFNPQIIHYIHGPSIRSFILGRILRTLCDNAKTVMTATRPNISVFSRPIIPLFKPDLVLVQSYESERLFKSMRCKTEPWLNGVDINRFAPISKEKKGELREKYGLKRDQFIILHVGRITKNRNVEILADVQKAIDGRVVVIGSTSAPPEAKIVEKLKNNGVILWYKFFENIEEIYAMSDCYLFPTETKGSVEFPLSVLEAMACNLAVVTTPFGALPRAFNEGNGLFYIGTQQDIIERLKEIKNGLKIQTREKVLDFSWGKVVNRLEDIYYQLYED